jgi:hypothetical protein
MRKIFIVKRKFFIGMIQHRILKKGSILFIMLLISIANFTSMVQAAPQIEINFFLKNGLMGFYVDPLTPKVLKDKVGLALLIWNSAMRWYIEGYTRDKFSPILLHLVENKEEADVLISFFINENTNILGYAKPYVVNDFLQSAEIHINLPPSIAADESELRTVAVLVHEIGHVLGLGHANLKEDIMYPIYDENPPNYGLPSTLDLGAVYRLMKHEVNPNTIFQGIDLWAIPAWVKQTPRGYEMSIPGFTIVYGCSFSYPEKVTLSSNELSSFTIGVTSECSVPIKIVSAKVTLDGEDYYPIDELPKIINPGSHYDFTWRIKKNTRLSESYADIEFEFGIPMMIGWETRRERIENAISITTAWIIMISGDENKIVPSSNTPFSPSDIILRLSIIIFLIIILTIIGIWGSRKSKYCFECGKPLPKSAKTCPYCGAKQEEIENFSS